MSTRMADAPPISGVVQQPHAATGWFRVKLTVVERKTLLLLMDLLLMNGSLLAALTIWNEFVPSLPLVFAYIKWFVTLSVLWLWFGTVLDIYDLARSASSSSITVNVGLTVVLTVLSHVAIPWLTPVVYARVYVLGFLILGMMAVSAWRLVYARGLVQPAFCRRALVLGTGAMAQTLMRELQRADQYADANPFRGTGYHVLGMVGDPLVQATDTNPEIPVLGDLRQIVRLSRQRQVDEIIIALDDQSASNVDIYQVLLDCRELGLRTVPVVEVYERLTARLPVEYAQYGIQALLDQSDNPAVRLYGSVKRLMDVVLALVALAGMGLLIPWIALWNALVSPGPLFYRQQRIGKGGTPFALWKFRSMVVNAEQANGVVWTIDNDPRITPVGRWLRKLRVDELPQCINVLRGEMSMVGPRPERPYFVGQLARELPLYRVRNAVKPGVTGWAQIRYRYGNSVEDSRMKLEYDLYYVKHSGPYLDLLILLQTPFVVLQGKGK